jgi:hypothetical protein
MHGGFATFDTIVDVPFVARHAHRSPDEVRRALRLPSDRPLVLSSFGGYGVNGLDLMRLDCLEEYGVVMTFSSSEQSCERLPTGVWPISEATLYDSGFRYEDLVGACDIVATKPGYGIIAECVANGTALLYTSRGNFAEYDALVACIPRYLRNSFIDHQALFAGRWRAALDRIMAAPPPLERPLTNGADVVAELILARF